MTTPEFDVVVTAAHKVESNTNTLYDRIAAAALPSASAGTKARGAGVASMLRSRFKGGADHPTARSASADAHADMNAIYHRLEAVVPGLAWLSNAELKKEERRHIIVGSAETTRPDEVSKDRLQLL